MMDTLFTYENAEGDRVKATSHEFVTRYKNQGFRRVTDEPADVDVTQVTPDFEHDLENDEEEETQKKRPRGNPMDPRDKKLPY